MLQTIAPPSTHCHLYWERNCLTHLRSPVFQVQVNWLQFQQDPSLYFLFWVVVTSLFTSEQIHDMFHQCSHGHILWYSMKLYYDKHSCEAGVSMTCWHIHHELPHHPSHVVFSFSEICHHLRSLCTWSYIIFKLVFWAMNPLSLVHISKCTSEDFNILTNLEHKLWIQVYLCRNVF